MHAHRELGVEHWDKCGDWGDYDFFITYACPRCGHEACTCEEYRESEKLDLEPTPHRQWNRFVEKWNGTVWFIHQVWSGHIWIGRHETLSHITHRTWLTLPYKIARWLPPFLPFARYPYHDHFFFKCKACELVYGAFDPRDFTKFHEVDRVELEA